MKKPRAPRISKSRYSTMRDAVQSGVQYGWNRAWKHYAMPLSLEKHVDRIIVEIINAVEFEMAEAFDWEEPDFELKRMLELNRKLHVGNCCAGDPPL